MPTCTIMPSREKYATHHNFRLNAHDTVVTRMCGGHADELDTSSTSLHLDAGEPEFRVVEGKLFLYHGNQEIRRIKKLSDITKVDRVTHPSGHIELSATAATLYKSLSDAVNRKIFVLKGPFDCANAFLKSTRLSSALPSDRPKIHADTWLPYFFTRDSPIRGEVEFNRVLPVANSEHYRLVHAVNVMRHGRLKDFLPNDTVVYLGGDHHEEVVGSVVSKNKLQDDRMLSGSATSRKKSKYVIYEDVLPIYGPGGDNADNFVHMASPFPNTWAGENIGYNNIGFTKLRNGHFVYWVTEDEPESGHQISKLPLGEIPYYDFVMPAEYKYECFSTDDNDTDSLEKVFEGAWIMRGDYLVENVKEEEYPEGVLDRLRGGFVKERQCEVWPNLLPMMGVIQKAVRSIEKYGAEMFGLTQRADGVVESDIESMASFLQLPVEALLAFMAKHASVQGYFRDGSINFLFSKKEFTGKKGIFEINKPVAVGSWMSGYVLDTGAGLLYLEHASKYCSVETKNGVSWISEYNGPGISERKELKLAPLIASASYKTHE